MCSNLKWEFTQKWQLSPFTHPHIKNVHKSSQIKPVRLRKMFYYNLFSNWKVNLTLIYFQCICTEKEREIQCKILTAFFVLVHEIIKACSKLSRLHCRKHFASFVMYPINVTVNTDRKRYHYHHCNQTRKANPPITRPKKLIRTVVVTHDSANYRFSV